MPEGQDPVVPEMVSVTTLDLPIQAAVREMKKGEVAHCSALASSFGARTACNVPEDGAAVLKLKLTLHAWRDNEKLTDCGKVLKKTLTEGGEDSRKAQALDGVTVEFSALALERPVPEGAEPPAEKEWDPVGGFEPFALDWTVDETDAVCPGLEEGTKAMKVGEVAEVTVRKGTHDPQHFPEGVAGDDRFASCAEQESIRATMTLKDIRRLPPSYELESVPKLLRAEELKAKGVSVVLLHPGFNRTEMTKKYEHIWDVEGAVPSAEGAMRVWHEIGRHKHLEDSGAFVNCEDGLRIPW